MAGSSDILMLLVKNGQTSGMPAECQTTLSTSDKLLNGPPKFEPGKFFELNSFTLTLSAQPGDSTADKNQPMLASSPGGKGGGPAIRQVHQVSHDTMWLPGILQPVSCTRQLDHASCVLFDQVGKETLFASAAIVRRKVVGGIAQADGSNQMGHLRLDFTDVQIIDVNWSTDDEGVNETFQFVCKKATVLYRQQTHTGSVSEKQFPPGKWP